MLNVHETEENQVNPASSQDTADSDADQDFAVFDIETAPLDDELLRKLCPECKIPPHPGEFDPSSVKLGNIKDKAKIDAKIEEARHNHQIAVNSYDEMVATAVSEHFEKFKAEAALDATTGSVVAIGVTPCPIVGNGPGIISCESNNSLCNEVSGLKLFWRWVSQNMSMQCPMIGLNIHRFDLPFLVRRSWILGIPVPHGVRQGRYWNPLFIDLDAVWNFGATQKYIGLDALAKVFGIEGKAKGEFTLPSGEVVLVDGANFYKAWRRPECRKFAEDYLMGDLRIPAELAVRMGVV
jgi:hypothetical protein